MGQFIDLESGDGRTVPAYVAEPSGAPRGGIVVIQEIFGVNSHIRSVADGFASDGYLAVAPALFERLEAGVEFGYSPPEVKAGAALKARAEQLPAPGVMSDVQAAIRHAGRASGKVGIVGYCWGGLISWRAACSLDGLSAAVTYYGGGMTTGDDAARQPKIPVLAHFGSQDSHIPNASVEAFREAHPGVEVHSYAAGHGFNCDQRGSYDEAAARLARERTLAFFARYVG